MGHYMKLHVHVPTWSVVIFQGRDLCYVEVGTGETFLLHSYTACINNNNELQCNTLSGTKQYCLCN